MRAFIAAATRPAAQTMPIAPPIEVPTQCTRVSSSASNSAAASRA